METHTGSLFAKHFPNVPTFQNVLPTDPVAFCTSLGIYLVCMDIKDACLHIPIHPCYMKFLKFVYWFFSHSVYCFAFWVFHSPRIIHEVPNASNSLLPNPGNLDFPLLIQSAGYFTTGLTTTSLFHCQPHLAVWVHSQLQKVFPPAHSGHGTHRLQVGHQEDADLLASDEGAKPYSLLPLHVLP